MINNQQFYNNGYNYNPYQTQQNFTKPVTNMEWVNGDIGASAYLVQGYNSAVALFDSETDDTMYIKTTDNTGRPYLRKFKFTEEIENQKPELDLSAYVKKDELQSLLLELISKKEGEINEQTLSTVQQQQPIIKKSITTAKQ